MGFNMVTKNGHNFYEMSSMLQKAIRRGDFRHAGYAANELSERYRNYLWKRLLIISAEDCYGIITKEIVGLKLADDEVRKSKKGENGNIFVSKAIVLLCQARKNRDACYFACNYMNSDTLLDQSQIPDYRMEDQDIDEIPDWVFDVHTLKGKINGKTLLEMVREEQRALHPKQLGLFDSYDWNEMFTREHESGRIDERQWAEYQEFKKEMNL